MSSVARSNCIRASDHDFAPDLFSADPNFFSAVSTDARDRFPHFNFSFPQAKKIARGYCIRENVDVHCTHFRAGRSMADVNGAKVSLVTRWVTKRTRHGCSFADVNVSQRNEKQGFSRQVGSNALWWMLTDRGRAREIRDREPFSFQAECPRDNTRLPHPSRRH